MKSILTLNERRERRGISLSEVARVTGIERTSVHMHHQKNRMPRLDQGVAYAHLYGCSPEAIVKGFLR